MIRAEALRDLIAKVEARDEPNTNDVWEAFQNDGGIGVYGLQVFPAYQGSLDAAKALHDAVLPGWWVQHMGQNLKGWGIRLGSNTHGEIPVGTLIPRYETPARAWLLAILRALLAIKEAQP